MAARGRGLIILYIYIENFKNLLVRNHRTDFIITWQKYFLVDPLPRLFKLSWFSKKPGHQGAGLFSLINLYRKVKKSSCQKPLDLFPYNFAEMFLWWPSSKIVQAIWIRQKTWPPGGGAYFAIYLYRKLKKYSCQKPLDWFHCRNVSFVTLYQDCSSRYDSSKNVAARGRGLFSLNIYIENFKTFLVRNHRTDFNIILQKYSFGDPLPRLFKPFGFVKKHGHQGAGLIFPIYLYRKL